MKMHKRWLLVAAMPALMHCARVAPWERGTLAAPHMQARPLPDADRQVMTVREIFEGLTFSAGGADGAGAGCGCN